MEQYIGVDFHRQFSQVAVMDKGGSILDERRLFHHQRDELARYFRGFAEGTPVVVEATAGWYWFADLLQELGLKVKLAHAKKLRIIAESTVKTDRIDARVLAHLDRLNFLPEAHITSPQARLQRELLRYHMSLVKIRSSIKNRIHAILAKHNVHYGFTDLFGKSGRAFLEALKLPDIFGMELKGYLGLLDELALVLKTVQTQIRKDCDVSPEAQLLETIPGVGPFGALLLVSEIDGIGRFGSAKRLIAYGGLCPVTRQSGNTVHQGRLIRDSNKYVRYILIEAVPHAVRKDPRLARFYRRLRRSKGMGKARAAVARKLLLAVYHMLKNKTTYRLHQDSVTTFRVNS